MIHYLPSLALRPPAVTPDCVYSPTKVIPEIFGRAVDRGFPKPFPKQERTCTKWDGCGTGLYLLVEDGTFKRGGCYMVQYYYQT